jgi:hypothetical protein
MIGEQVALTGLIFAVSAGWMVLITPDFASEKLKYGELTAFVAGVAVSVFGLLIQVWS